MADGLQRHGITVARLTPGQATTADFVVCWGWRVAQPYRDAGLDVLVLERGHVGDRRRYTSAGWNGLGRYGIRPQALDEGQRWRDRHGHLLETWTKRDGYALLLGQVPTDAAVSELADYRQWAHETAHALRVAGWGVRYRPHPLTAGRDLGPEGTQLSTGTLAADLAGAAVAVAYSSTAAVEAVLAGVPIITLGEGAIAWDVAGHALGEVVRPDREPWAHRLAWSQWAREELADGTAWEALTACRH